jgi:hypothetical protein
VVNVQKGQPVTVFVKALNTSAPGKVLDIATEADKLGGDVVYKTTIALDKMPAGLRAYISRRLNLWTIQSKRSDDTVKRNYINSSQLLLPTNKAKWPQSTIQFCTPRNRIVIGRNSYGLVLSLHIVRFWSTKQYQLLAKIVIFTYICAY